MSNETKALSTYDPTLRLGVERVEQDIPDPREGLFLKTNAVCNRCGSPASWWRIEDVWRHAEPLSENRLQTFCDKYGYAIEVTTPEIFERTKTSSQDYLCWRVIYETFERLRSQDSPRLQELKNARIQMLRDTNMRSVLRSSLNVLSAAIFRKSVSDIMSRMAGIP